MGRSNPPAEAMRGSEEAARTAVPAAKPGPGAVPDLLPVRMLNEFTYCPRLFHIEWVQGEFADNAETVDGRYQHRRVDRKDGKLPEGDARAEEIAEPPTLHTRSVWLSAESIRLTAKIDLIELTGWRAVPVEYKRGHPPDLSRARLGARAGSGLRPGADPARE